MNRITFDELKAKPDQIIENLCRSRTPCLITREDNRNLVILSQQEYDTIMGTMNGIGQTVAEIENRYADQWILMKETVWDEQGNPVRGVVVASSPDREALTEPVRQLRRKNPGVRTYIFFTGDVTPENAVVML